jgi:hypothetical protein
MIPECLISFVELAHMELSDVRVLTSYIVIIPYNLVDATDSKGGSLTKTFLL